jgi:Zn ribbon nucleic-acid-binding protein
MTPKAEYNDQRYCPSCKTQTRVHIRLEEQVVMMTCNDCHGAFEFERFRDY